MSKPDKIPSKSMRRLIYWMEERQRIWLQRQAGKPWPWTKDPILQRYRFCNTYREQDKETIWLRTHWREPYAEHPNLWFACCMFRQINWSPTLEETGFPERWEPKRVLKIMNARASRGEKVYTSAYLIRGGQEGPGSKPRWTVTQVLDSVWKAYNKHNWSFDNQTLEASWEWLKQFPGWGPFTAYEVVSDLRHTRHLRNASDIETWGNVGPGALRGLNRLLVGTPKGPITFKYGLDYMRACFDYVNRHRNASILPTLEMRDIEHSLCEYDKYCRASGSARTGLEIFSPKNRTV